MMRLVCLQGASTDQKVCEDEEGKSKWREEEEMSEVVDEEGLGQEERERDGAGGLGETNEQGDVPSDKHGEIAEEGEGEGEGVRKHWESRRKQTRVLASSVDLFTAQPCRNIPGHTGYLTFATLYPKLKM